MHRGAWQATVQKVSKSQTQLNDYHFLCICEEHCVCKPRLLSVYCAALTESLHLSEPQIPHL